MKTGCPKVLHLITHLAVGGAQDNTLLTVAKHDRTKFTVHLAANPMGEWCDRAQAVTDQFHPLPDLVRSPHPWKDLKTLIAIVRLLRQEQFDVVHTHASKAGVLGRWAAQIARVPVVVHTTHALPFHAFIPAWKRQLYLNWERSARSCTDFFITVSELNRKEAINLGIMGTENSQTIYSGIDFEQLDSPCDIQHLKQQLNIPDGWQIIAMVGRLDQQKAPHYLIEAFAKVLKHHPRTILLLVGGGELEPDLVHQVQLLDIADHVQFLGYRDDIPDLLNIADVFALSSLWEGLGRAMTEAMLLGKPVVVPNIYGIPEIVHHRETGLLFPAGDVEQLADHLSYLLQDVEECDRLGRNAKQLTRQLFDANSMVQQIEHVYDRLLK